MKPKKKNSARQALSMAVRLVGQATAILALSSFFFLLSISPARAPKGGKYSLGGRTIASQQEEDFDRRLLRYQLCYGVRLQAASATQERRRACKAMLVNRLDSFMAEAGRVFTQPLIFQCENTALGQKEWLEEGTPVGALRPNAEFPVMTSFFERYSEKLEVDPFLENRARTACDFLTECKDSMRFQHWSFRRIGSCLSDKDALHRKWLLDEIAGLIFRGKPKAEKLLLAELYKLPR